jgi:hypothetical protein
MSHSATDRVRWTTADLDLPPDNGTRYEIIDGAIHDQSATLEQSEGC